MLKSGCDPTSDVMRPDFQGHKTVVLNRPMTWKGEGLENAPRLRHWSNCLSLGRDI